MATDVPALTLWSDIGCPWAHVAVSRLHRTRERLGLVGRVVVEHRAFPLELVNRQPTPKALLHAEVAVTAALEPAAGWQPWTADDGTWPVTMLPALEAVRAARRQSAEAAEELDRRLRRAFFGESRCVSMRHEILDVAAGCATVDAVALEEELDSGAARAGVLADWREATGPSSPVKGSPHLFLPDGGEHHNPGIRFHWEQGEGRGFPTVDGDDPAVYEAILSAVAG